MAANFFHSRQFALIRGSFLFVAACPRRCNMAEIIKAGDL
jgi:hypothetical protein